MSDPQCTFDHMSYPFFLRTPHTPFMKTRKTQKAAAVKSKTNHLNVNLDYVDEIADESIASLMAMRALIHQQADEIARLRAELEVRQ